MNNYEYFRDREEELRQNHFRSYLLSNERSQQKFISSTFRCQERLADSDSFSRGVLLDGFPRTRAQAVPGVLHFWGCHFSDDICIPSFETLISTSCRLVVGKAESLQKAGVDISAVIHLEVAASRLICSPLNLLICSIELWFISMFDVMCHISEYQCGSMGISWHFFILAWR